MLVSQVLIALVAEMAQALLTHWMCWADISVSRLWFQAGDVGSSVLIEP